MGWVSVTESHGSVTLQDGGRRGVQRFGVTGGGTMDPHASALASRLAGNPPEGVVFELEGPSRLALRCEGVFGLALAGAGAPVSLDGFPVPFWARIETDPLRPFVIRIEGTRGSGRWSYLALTGGCRVAPVMGSFGTDLRAGWGGVEGRRLRAGDRVPLGAAPARLTGCFSRPGFRIRGQVSPWLRSLVGSAEPVVRILPGSHWEAFPSSTREVFLASRYRITTDSDRMGYRLAGAAIHPEPVLEIDSEPVAFGSIQIPPDGAPIILMADHPPQGGYPHLAEVIGADLGLLAQCRAGDEVRFRLVDEPAALQALREWRRGFARLGIGLAADGGGGNGEGRHA